MENRLEDELHDRAHDEEDEKKIYGAKVPAASVSFVMRSFGQQSRA